MFYIRADANETIGTGHIMRCLSIAEEIKRQGEDVTFIIADKRSETMITAKGFSVICLDSIWNDLEKEIDCLIEVIKKQSISLLLIDSYFVTRHYLESLRKETKIAYIDDLNMFIYPVDCLINYNIYADSLNYAKRYEQEGISNIKFALGCSYVPLREEFSNLTHEINNKVSRVLITSGGTDNYNVVENILQTLFEQECFLQLEYYVILGRFNTHKLELEKKWGGFENVHLLSDVTNMVDYMKLCDVAITAGGVTTYELCASGIPSIMYTLADNQHQIAQTVSEMKLISWIGDVRIDMGNCMQKMIFCLEDFFEDREKRKQLSQRMQKLVDGNGCRRLVKRIACENN